MFARKLKLALARGGAETPVPKDWLDHFFMRYFTGFSAFDETLPVADGEIEAGLNVDPAEVKARFEQWLRGRKMIPPDAELVVR